MMYMRLPAFAAASSCSRRCRALPSNQTMTLRAREINDKIFYELWSSICQGVDSESALLGRELRSRRTRSGKHTYILSPIHPDTLYISFSKPAF